MKVVGGGKKEEKSEIFEQFEVPAALKSQGNVECLFQLLIYLLRFGETHFCSETERKKTGNLNKQKTKAFFSHVSSFSRTSTALFFF